MPSKAKPTLFHKSENFLKELLEYYLIKLQEPIDHYNMNNNSLVVICYQL